MGDRQLTRRRTWALRIGFAIVLVAGWYVLAALSGGLFLATPDKIAAGLAASVRDGEFVTFLRPTAYILVVGAGAGVLVGVPVGLLLGRYQPLYWLTEAPVNIFYTTPLVALIPFLLVLVGFNVVAKMLIVFLFTVLPVVINTSVGVRTVDPDLFELASSYCAPEWTIWRDVIVPAAVPAVMTGLRLGLIHALVGAVLADFYAGASGFGYLIIKHSNNFDIAAALGPVVVLAASGIAVAAFLKWLQRRLAPWQVGV